MDGIRRLLRVAAERNVRADSSVVRFRMDGELARQLRERLDEEGISLTVFMEAVCRGYVRGHHAVLAMIDQWIREECPEAVDQGPKLSTNDLNEIYAAVADGGKIDGGATDG